MENLAPPLEVLLEIEYCLKSGQSLQTAVNEVAKKHQSEFTPHLEKLLQSHLRAEEYLFEGGSIYRRNLLLVLQQGLRGHSILERLEELRVEIEWSAQAEFDRFVSRLPFMAMIPLMAFFFPAYLLVLLGPVLLQFVEVLQR